MTGPRAGWAFDARVAWQPVASAGGYRLYIRPSGQTWPQGTDVGPLAADPDGVVRYVARGLATGVTQEFAVSAYDGAGSESALSNVLSLLVTDTPTPVPTATAAPATATSVPPTAIPTATATSVPPTAILTATATPIPPTATNTATRTATIATPTSVATATATRTATATATRSATSTGTATRTPTGSATATPTATPSETPTPTAVPAGLVLSGQLRYHGDGGAVSGASLELQGGAQSLAAWSDGTGEFAFADMQSGGWELTPSKLGDARDGVSALDAARVLRAVSGNLHFTTLQALACDVTGDGTVSTLDATLILQFATGAITRFPAATACGSDWVFQPQPIAVSSQSITQPALNAGVCRPGAITYAPLEGPTSGQDFVAVLLGDCTGNWHDSTTAGAFRRRGAVPQVWLAAARRERAQRWLVAVHASGPSSAQALEARIVLDDARARLHAVAVPGAPGALARFGPNDNGRVTLAVASAVARPLDEHPLAVLVVDNLVDNAPPDVRLLAASVDEQIATVTR
ncbi:MAG TPA: dockerin type I repeat-containing protein [Candidatus Dormibacteraeota bacterium]|nr:dockerin type I repeat-containing protein [Candidatus Dormibacteraeota bacterium]